MKAGLAVPLWYQRRAGIHEVSVPHELDVLDALDASPADAVEEFPQLAQAGEREGVGSVEGMDADVQPSLRNQKGPEDVVGFVGERQTAGPGANMESVQEPGSAGTGVEVHRWMGSVQAA